jgi:ribosomal 50S subunit-recycling heat shock protein
MSSCLLLLPPAPGFPMRLDLFLKASRLSGRRTLAQKLCDAGRVSLNGKPAKSSHAVKAGDEILIRRNHRLTTVRVLSLPMARQTARQEASTLYEVLSEESLNDEEPGE